MSLTEVNEELHRRSREADPTLPGDADFQPKSILPESTDVPPPWCLWVMLGEGRDAQCTGRSRDEI